MTKNIKIFFFIFILFNIASYIDLPQRVYFYNLKLLFFVFLTLVLSASILVKKSKRIGYSIPNRNILIVIYIWCLLLLPSIIGSGGNAKSFLLVGSYLLLGYFSFIILPTHMKNIDIYTSFNKVWIYSIVVGVIFAIGLSFLGMTSLSYINVHTGRERYNFSFVNSNFFGGLSYIVILATLINLLINKGRNKIFQFGFLAIAFWLLILSDSRSPLYALLIWGFIFLISKPFKNGMKKIIVFCFVSPFVFLSLLFVNFSVADLDRLLSYRITNWSILLSSINGSDWLAGLGLGETAESLNITQSAITFDNSYISILTQSGVLGLAGLFLFLITTLYYILKMKEREFKLIAIATYSSWLLYCLFESSIFSSGYLPSIFVWSTIGILIKIDRERVAPRFS